MSPASFVKRERLAALIVAGLGAFMLWEGLDYPFGTPQRMGPGFFPVILGFLLVAMGAAIAIEVGPSSIRPMPSATRAFVMIIGAIVAFAIMLPRWGLLPATVALVMLSAAADKPFRPVTALVTAAVLALMGYLVFIEAFGLPLTALRW